jgi:beta-alanine degradation protein BauB
MNRSFRCFVVALLSQTAWGISTGQDPVKVSPDHYKIEIENEFVRVLRSSGGGHVTTPMHEHPANVVVYLKDADVRVVGPDGSKKDSRRKRGDAIWNGPQKHERVNLNEKPYELIQVELKGKREAPTPWTSSLDPVKLARGQFSVIFENELVRVLRVRRGAYAKSVMHVHPAYVWVAFTDLHTRIFDQDGDSREIKHAAGSVGFSSAAKHSEENLLPQPFEAILVELK